MKEMPKKIKIAKITFYVTAIWGLVMPTLFFLGTFYWIDRLSFKNMSLESIILFFAFMIMIIVGIAGGIFYIFIAKAINNQKKWAKTAGIILAALSVPSFPLGTTFGTLVLVGLLSKEADSWFKDQLIMNAKNVDNKTDKENKKLNTIIATLSCCAALLFLLLFITLTTGAYYYYESTNKTVPNSKPLNWGEIEPLFRQPLKDRLKDIKNLKDYEVNKKEIIN